MSQAENVAPSTKQTPPKWVQPRGPRKPYSSKELITLNNMPSNAQLKSLNVRPYFTIRWKRSNDAESSILFESFPRPLAIAFSDVCRKSGQNFVVIVGSSDQRIKRVFQYMLDSAKGQGCSPPPVPERLKYCDYVKNAVDASIVNVPLLEQEYETRRIMIENMQVHSADVEMIYRDRDSKGMAVRDNVARSIARRLASKTLKAYPAYASLRKQLPEFDADMKRVLEELQKPIKEEKQRLRREAEQQAWTRHIAEARQGEAKRRANNQINHRMKAPPAHTREPPTAEKVQTSLGPVWAAVPIKEKSKGKGRNGPMKNTILVGEASSPTETTEKSKSPAKQPIDWADEMAERDGKNGNSTKDGGLDGEGGPVEDVTSSLRR